MQPNRLTDCMIPYSTLIQYPEWAVAYQTHGVRFFCLWKWQCMYSPLCPVHKGYNSATVLHMPLYILIKVVETAALSLRVPWLCSQYLAMWWLSHLHLPHFHDLFRHGNALSDMTFLWKEFLGRIRCKQVQSACCEGANAKKNPWEHALLQKYIVNILSQ